MYLKFGTTFADDIAVLLTHADVLMASSILQRHLNDIEVWTKKWITKINESKSNHIHLHYTRQHSIFF